MNAHWKLGMLCWKFSRYWKLSLGTGKKKGKESVNRVISHKHINKKGVLDQLRSKVSIA